MTKKGKSGNGDSRAMAEAFKEAMGKKVAQRPEPGPSPMDESPSGRPGVLLSDVRNSRMARANAERSAMWLLERLVRREDGAARAADKLARARNMILAASSRLVEEKEKLAAAGKLVVSSRSKYEASAAESRDKAMSLLRHASMEIAEVLSSLEGGAG